MRGMIKTVIAVLLAMTASGCEVHQSTRLGNNGGHAAIYRMSQDDALGIAWEATRSVMGGAFIKEHPGRQRGYYTEFRFGFDTFVIDVTVVPGFGTDAAGEDVEGYYFDVAGRGSSFLQGHAKAEEILKAIKDMADASGTRVEVASLRPSRNIKTDVTAATPSATLNPSPAVAQIAPSALAKTNTSAPAADPLSQLRFATTAPRPDDVAVVIGISAYNRVGRDIPAVPPAKNDAAAIRRYVTEGLGVPTDNVIFLEDATSAQLVEVFGNERDHRGKLFNWVKPKVSRVFIYYAGHGAPAGDRGSPMLVPIDASASQIALSGYPLATLYANLTKLPAENVTVVLEACFSGATAAGSLVPAASPVSLVAKELAPPAQLTVLAAGTANQIASWRQDRTHGLFTEFFLRGQAGEADQPPYGNGDGKVGLDELERYLKDKVTYWARRDWGRDQNVQFFHPAGASR